MLRDHINAIIGFERLVEGVGTLGTSLMRMMSAWGNPPASNLFAVISPLRKATGMSLMAGVGG